MGVRDDTPHPPLFSSATRDHKASHTTLFEHGISKIAGG
jgi:hypothetical protein